MWRVVARRIAQPPKRPLSRGSNPSGYPAEPLVSYQINRELSGWNLPSLVIRAFEAHCQLQTSLCRGADPVTRRDRLEATGQSHPAGRPLTRFPVEVLLTRREPCSHRLVGPPRNSRRAGAGRASRPRVRHLLHLHDRCCERGPTVNALLTHSPLKLINNRSIVPRGKVKGGQARRWLASFLATAYKLHCRLYACLPHGLVWSRGCSTRGCCCDRQRLPGLRALPA